MGRGWAEYRYLSVASRSILFSFGRYTLYKQDIDKVTIFCDDIIIVLSSDHRVCFLIICEAICHFHARTIARKRKAWFHLRMSRIIFATKHSWATLLMSRPLFVSSYLQVTWWALSQWKGKKICIEWKFLMQHPAVSKESCSSNRDKVGDDL